MRAKTFLVLKSKINFKTPAEEPHKKYAEFRVIESITAAAIRNPYLLDYEKQKTFELNSAAAKKAQSDIYSSERRKHMSKARR